MTTSFAVSLFARMRNNGRLPAVICDGNTIAYAELLEKALKVAGTLRACGARGETIGIVGQRNTSSYYGILGIIFAGCSYVPINPKYNPQRLIAILRDANVRYLVGDTKSLSQVEAYLQTPDSPVMNALILPDGRAPSGKSWVDETSPQVKMPLETPINTSGDNLAYVMYTSGSTGAPKGVQVTNANILAFLRSMDAIYKMDVGFRASQTFDFSFDPSVSDMFFTWANGGTLCVLPEAELLLPHEYIIRENITYWNSVPAIAGFLFKMGHLKPGIFPLLTHSMFCGEQFPKYLADAWRKAAPNSTIENLYGPTEATIYISRHLYSTTEVNHNFKNSIIPIGRPFLDHKFALVDEGGKQVPAGETGEIVFKGPQITRGYLNDERKTASSFVSFEWDPSGQKWYRSGDLGFYNHDGNLECIGRRDSQIKLGGRRIEIGEIEAVLGAYPELANAVVVPLRDANQVVTGCVAFVTSELPKELEASIRRDSEKSLERIFFPRKIIYISSFPLAPSGKIDRKKLASIASELLGPKS